MLGLVPPLGLIVDLLDQVAILLQRLLEPGAVLINIRERYLDLARLSWNPDQAWERVLEQARAFDRIRR